MRPELKIVLVAVEIIVVIAAALALEQCGTGSGNSDKGYISGEYSGGAQENIDYEAKTVAIDSGHGGIDPGKISADGILEKDVNLAIASKLKILLEQSGITVIMTRADDNGLKPRITENGIDYILVGDYYIPDLKLPEEHRPIGKYGRMHREYLREVHPARLNTLILTGELWTYLADLNEQAQERLDTIMEQMKTAEGVTEELKRTHQMEWVQRCNNIHNRAEEIVLHEMIYS